MLAEVVPEQTVSHHFVRLAVERASMVLVVSVAVVVAVARASMVLVVSVAVVVVVVEFAVTEVVSVVVFVSVVDLVVAEAVVALVVFMVVAVAAVVVAVRLWRKHSVQHCMTPNSVQRRPGPEGSRYTPGAPRRT